MADARTMLAVTELAEKGLASVAPGVAEKLALSLPEIFGPGGKAAASVFAKAPADAETLGRLSVQLQERLATFGLPASATPSELFQAMDQSGLAARMVGRGGRHYAGQSETVFDDGSVLWRSLGAGRSGRVETTVFGTADHQFSIAESSSNFFGTPKHTVSFRTPSVEMEANFSRLEK